MATANSTAALLALSACRWSSFKHGSGEARRGGAEVGFIRVLAVVEAHKPRWELAAPSCDLGAWSLQPSRRLRQHDRGSREFGAGSSEPAACRGQIPFKLTTYSQ